MASHEFRTPLSAVLSSAAIASQNISKEDEQEKRINILTGSKIL